MTMDDLKKKLRDLLARLPVDRFRNPPPVVGVIRLDGVIGRGAGLGRQGLSLDSHERAMQKTIKQLTRLSSVVDKPLLLRISDFNA